MILVSNLKEDAMKKIALLLVLFVVLCAVPAFAQIYVGGGYGLSGLTVTDAINSTAHQQTWKVFGGYEFGKFLSAEAAYTDFSTTGTKTVKRSSNMASVSVLPMLPISSSVSLFGRAGVIEPAKANLTNFGSTMKYVFGGGVQLALNPVFFRVEYEQYKDVSPIKNNVDLIDASIGIKF
jgi:Outer membrane protein beta-barrel domain